MRVLVQWARSTAGDWEEVDSGNWVSLPDRGSPPVNPIIDGSPGWVNAVCVQGNVFEADRIALEDHADGSLSVFMVNDDPRSWTPLNRYARVMRFWPLAPDPKFGQAVNTRFEHVIYSDSSAFSQAGVIVRPWSALVMPFGARFRHGVTLPGALYQDHVRARSTHSWREWVDGLAAHQVVNGRLRSQRRLGLYDVPKGTKTFYLNPTALASGVHISTQELELALIPSGVANLVSDTITSSGIIAFIGTTLAAEPNESPWPTGNYRFQIDCASAHADATYGLLTTGTALGHFARVDSGLLLDLETKAQVEAAFSGAGLKLATTGSVNWAAGAASNRFEVAIAAERIAGMGTATMTLEVGEFDDFADGPWTSVAADNMMLFGVEF